MPESKAIPTVPIPIPILALFGKAKDLEERIPSRPLDEGSEVFLAWPSTVAVMVKLNPAFVIVFGL